MTASSTAEGAALSVSAEHQAEDESDDEVSDEQAITSRPSPNATEASTPADAAAGPTTDTTTTESDTDTASAPSTELGQEPDAGDDITPITSIEAGPIEISELSVTPKLLDAATGQSQLTLTMTTNRCVFLRVTGSTSLSDDAGWDEYCIMGHRAILTDRLGPGDYSITVHVWDEHGSATSRDLPFTVPPASSDPCRFADSVPEVWRVESGRTAQLQLAVTGDCGPVTWSYDPASSPDGFRLVDDVLHASPTGPARSEVVAVSVTPTRGAFLWTRIDLAIVTENMPEIVPCKPATDQSLLEGGVLRLRLSVGETLSTRFEAVGDCGNYQWGHDPLPPGVSFNDGLLTVTGETPGRSELLFVSLRPEHGTSWSSAFEITVIE